MDLHIDNIIKDMKKDDFQAYLLTQFTNVEYISNYKPTSFAFCIIKDNPIIPEGREKIFASPCSRSGVS